MPLYDVNYKLATDIDVSADANGADVSIAQGGALEGLKSGMICEAVLQFNGAISNPNSDGTLFVYIEEKIGSNYRAIGCFPQLGTAADPDATYASNGGELTCFFTPSFNATALRYRVDIGGTGGPVYNDMNIYIHPLNYAPTR
jgi:hypothetical protein